MTKSFGSLFFLMILLAFAAIISVMSMSNNLKPPSLSGPSMAVVMERSIHSLKHEEYATVNSIFNTGECSEGFRAELYSQKLNKWMFVCQVGQKIPVRFAGWTGRIWKVMTEYFAKDGYPLQVAKDYISKKILEDGYVLKAGQLPKGISVPLP